MDLNLSKFLRSCKKIPSRLTIQDKKHWSSSKNIKSSSDALIKKKEIIQNTKASLNLHSAISIPYSLNSSLYTKKSSEKIKPPEKSIQKPTLFQYESQNEIEKIYHIYSIPKQLKTVKKYLSTSIKPSAIAEKEKKFIIPKKKNTANSNDTFILKSFKSKELLKKNSFYNESFLKSLSDKFDNETEKS